MATERQQSEHETVRRTIGPVRLVVWAIALLGLIVVLIALVVLAFGMMFFSASDGLLGLFLLLVAAPMLVSFPIYVNRCRRRKLDDLRRAQTPKRKPALIVAGSLAFIGLIAYALWIDFPAKSRGAPPGVPELSGRAFGSPRHFCVSSFLNSEWIWRAHASEADLERLVERLELEPSETSRVDEDFLKQRPYWWDPVISERTRVFRNGYPDPDNRSFTLTWDPEDELAYVYIHVEF